MKTFLSTHKRDGVPGVRGVGTLPPHLPRELSEVLTQLRGGSFASGFFEFVDSNSASRYLSLWQIDSTNCVTFLKCGFGQLLFYQAGEYKLLNPIYNEIDVVGDEGELEFVLDVFLCDRRTLDASFLMDLYERAFPRLGPPKEDEIYALVPALGLGGSRDAAHVKVAKMQSEMPILAQL